MESIFDKYAEELIARRFATLKTDWITEELLEYIRADLCKRMSSFGISRKSEALVTPKKLKSWLMWTLVPLFKRYDISGIRNLQVLSHELLHTVGRSETNFSPRLCKREAKEDEIFVAVLNLNSEDLIMEFPFGTVVIASGHILIMEEYLFIGCYEHRTRYEDPSMLFLAKIRLTEESAEGCFCSPWKYAREPPARYWVLPIPANHHYMGHLCM